MRKSASANHQFQQKLRSYWPTLVMAAAFAGYCIWNLAFLSKGHLAPSLFKAITGYPCATTGCTRAFRALLQGEFGLSLFYNPFLLIFLFLIAASIWQVIQKRVLSPWLSHGWLATLAIAWIYKLFSPANSW